MFQTRKNSSIFFNFKHKREEAKSTEMKLHEFTMGFLLFLAFGTASGLP